MFATAMTKFLDRILMLFLKYIKIGRKKYSLAAWTHPSRASVCVCVCQSYLMDSSNPVSKNRFCITTRIRIAFFEFSSDLDTNNERNIFCPSKKRMKRTGNLQFHVSTTFFFYNGRLTTFISSSLDSEISIKLSINFHRFSSKKKKKKEKNFIQSSRADIVAI